MRLIDADSIKKKAYYSEDGYLVVDVSDIDDSPTIEFSNAWIPVHEHPPEEDEDVILQFKEGRDCPDPAIQIGHIGEHVIENNNFEQIGIATVWYTDEYYYPFEQVIAWMPLPEPYETEKHEE